MRDRAGARISIPGLVGLPHRSTFPVIKLLDYQDAWSTLEAQRRNRSSTPATVRPPEVGRSRFALVLGDVDPSNGQMAIAFVPQPCVGAPSPAPRNTGMCRGEARASQVTGPSSSCVPWSYTPPEMNPSWPTHAGAIVAFDIFPHSRHPGRLPVSGLLSHSPHVRLPTPRLPCFHD